MQYLQCFEASAELLLVYLLYISWFMGSFNVKVRQDPKEFVQNYFIVHFKFQYPFLS